MSVTQLWERFFISAIDDAEGLAESNPLGITTVVTLCPERVPEEVKGIDCLYLPLLHNCPLPVGMFDEIIDVLWENIRWGKVLVQSLAGVNRAPIVAAAWMHVVGCKTIDAALIDIDELRSIKSNPVLLKSIKEHL